MRQVRSYGSRLRVPHWPVGESMTEQSHAGLCDINNIVSRYQSTGMLPPPTQPPTYADVTQLSGGLLDRIQFAQDVFDRASAASPDEAPPPPPPTPDPVQPAP